MRRRLRLQQDPSPGDPEGLEGDPGGAGKGKVLDLGQAPEQEGRQDQRLSGQGEEGRVGKEVHVQGGAKVKPHLIR